MMNSVKKFGYQSEYNLWLYLFIAFNIIGAVIMFFTNVLIGDLPENQLYSVTTLWIATFLVSASYFIILKPIYHFFIRLKVPQFIKWRRNMKADGILGVILFVTQILFLLFNIIEGVNTAGTNHIKTESPLAVIWALIPIDGMFLIYYALHRDDKWFKYNVFIYFLSNLIRGWAGVFLVVIFLEWCRAFRKGKINFVLLIVLGAIIILIYPFLHYSKTIIRGFGGDFSNLSFFFDLFFNDIRSKNYVDMFMEGVTQLIGRMQQTSILVDIIHYRDYLRVAYNNGDILAFWDEGIVQLIYRKIMGIPTNPNNMSIQVVEYLLPSNGTVLGSWNISVGFLAWIIIVPSLIPQYILYNAFLCYMCVFLMKQLDYSKEGAFDIVWFGWLVFLLAGWNLQFSIFIYGIFVYILFEFFADRLARIRFTPLKKS